jgi:hypothetical protein
MCVQPERQLSSRVLTVGSFLFRFSLGMWFIYNLYIHICLFSSGILRCHPNKYYWSGSTEKETPSLVRWSNQVIWEEWECKIKIRKTKDGWKTKDRQDGEKRKINLGHPPCTESSTLHSLFYAFHSLYTPPTFTPSKTSHRQPQSAPHHHLPNLSAVVFFWTFLCSKSPESSGRQVGHEITAISKHIPPNRQTITYA